MGMSALVLEDIETRQIRFLRCIYNDDRDSQNGSSSSAYQRRLKLVQLGVMVSEPLSVSKLIKYRSVVKVDPLTQKHY